MPPPVGLVVVGNGELRRGQGPGLQPWKGSPHLTQPVGRVAIFEPSLKVRLPMMLDQLIGGLAVSGAAGVPEGFPAAVRASAAPEVSLRRGVPKYLLKLRSLAVSTGCEARLNLHKSFQCLAPKIFWQWPRHMEIVQ